MSIREVNSHRVLQYGNTNAERTKNNMIAKIKKDFSSNPSLRQVIRNGIETLNIIITDNSSNSTKKVDNIRSIIMHPDDVLNIGDLFDYNNKKWLTTSVEMFLDIYYKGLITECNNTLRFYKSGILYNIPCIFSDGNPNMEEGKFISLPSGHYLLTIPSGVINKSDLNLRFILNGSPYDTVGINNATNGLVKIEIKDGTLNEKDDLTNGIAWNEGNPIHSYTIEILNGAEQTVKYGETLTLNVQVKDFGAIITPTPVLLFETSNGTVCTVNANGVVLATNSSGSTTVTVRLASDTNVFATITIIDAPSSVINYTYTLIGSALPDTSISYNQTKTYTATKYDNSNNIVSTQFLFQVLGSIPTDKYQLTILSDTQCSIKCLGYPYIITLRAMDLSNTQYVEKQINFKSLM